MSDLIISGAANGVGATIAIDLWAVLVNRIFGVALPNWRLVGRWFRYLGRGRVFHHDIAAAAAFGHELRLGWAARPPRRTGRGRSARTMSPRTRPLRSVFGRPP